MIHLFDPILTHSYIQSHKSGNVCGVLNRVYNIERYVSYTSSVTRIVIKVWV